MNKIIVLHDKFSNEPIVIRTNAIKAVRKVFDEDIAEEWSEILIESCFLTLCVKETIGTVITRIDNAESEVNNGN